MAAPFIIGFAVFIGLPMLYSIYLSLHKWDLLTPPRYVGLKTFRRVLTDPKTSLVLYNSAFYTAFAVPLQLVLSFSLAMALNQRIGGRNFYRSVFFLPLIVPTVAGAVVWSRIFHPEFGILNEALGWFGVPPQAWLFKPYLAKPAFIFMSLWSIGRQMTIFLAGLQSIPPSLLDAASIDGASRLGRFLHVVLPLMTPIIFYNMVIAIIRSLQIFGSAFIMTGGGPQDATLFAVLYIYRHAFQYFKMGFASALSWLLFIIIVGFTVVQFLMAKRWVYYEE